MKICILCGQDTESKYDICDKCAEEIVKEAESKTEKDRTDNG